jgi:hypothetical protein
VKLARANPAALPPAVTSLTQQVLNTLDIENVIAHCAGCLSGVVDVHSMDDVVGEVTDAFLNDFADIIAEVKERLASKRARR